MNGGTYFPYTSTTNQTTTSHDSTMQSDLLNRIAEIRANLLKKIETVSQIKSEGYIDLIYYFVIVGIMMFFLYILLADVYKTLKFYKQQNEDSSRTSYGSNSKSKTYFDDNEYDSKYDTINYTESISRNLNVNNQELENEFDRLLRFKSKNNLDTNLYASIDTKVISRENDDYDYPKEKNNTSYWSLLFEKPKYPSITNNSDGSFFEFV